MARIKQAFGTFKLLALLGAIALSACSAPSKNFSTGDYTVHPTDTLYSIAWRYGLDVRQLAAWNGLSKPYRVQTGQRLLLQAPLNQAPSSASAPVTPPKKIMTAKSTAAPPVLPEKLTQTSKTVANIQWKWPASGRVLQKYRPKSLDRRGIDIEGQFRQPVVAAAAGKVVYSGNALQGFGHLIIIKHNDSFLSAYAHNHKRLVQEGQSIKVGQKIAEMGKNPEGKIGLHFQIRKNGKPTNPENYLPSR